jgi:hypothetical protein
MEDDYMEQINGDRDETQNVGKTDLAYKKASIARRQAEEKRALKDPVDEA